MAILPERSPVLLFVYWHFVEELRVSAPDQKPDVGRWADVHTERVGVWHPCDRYKPDTQVTGRQSIGKTGMQVLPAFQSPVLQHLRQARPIGSGKIAYGHAPVTDFHGP